MNERMLCAAFAATLLISAAADAASSRPGGVIHFKGSIVEKPCSVAQRDRDVTLRCFEKGKFNALQPGSEALTPEGAWLRNNTHVSMHYLTPDNATAVVMVSYR